MHASSLTGKSGYLASVPVCCIRCSLIFGFSQLGTVSMGACSGCSCVRPVTCPRLEWWERGCVMRLSAVVCGHQLFLYCPSLGQDRGSIYLYSCIFCFWWSTACSGTSCSLLWAQNVRSSITNGSHLLPFTQRENSLYKLYVTDPYMGVFRC